MRGEPKNICKVKLFFIHALNCFGYRRSEHQCTVALIYCCTLPMFDCALTSVGKQAHAKGILSVQHLHMLLFTLTQPHLLVGRLKRRLSI